VRGLTNFNRPEKMTEIKREEVTILGRMTRVKLQLGGTGVLVKILTIGL
jgi:hypothetical protein